MGIARSLVGFVVAACWNVSAQPADGDAICKKDPMPAGWVPVGELASPQCGPSGSPFDMNAWILGRLQPGTIACAAPDYSNDPAPNIGYIACGTASASNCPSRLDGTQNAVILQPFLACVRDSYKARNDLCAGINIGGHCFQGASAARKFKQLDQLGELDKWLGWTGKAIGAESSWVLGRAYQSQSLADDSAIESKLHATAWPLCLAWNEKALVLIDRDVLAAWQGSSQADIQFAQRMFFDPSCPAMPGELNALVLRRLAPSEYRGTELLVCGLPIGSALNVYTDFETFKAAHDDRCGTRGYGPKLLNAYKTRLAAEYKEDDHFPPPPRAGLKNRPAPTPAKPAPPLFDGVF